MADEAKSRLIVLEGPSGTGKSTLQKHLAENLESRGYRVGLLPEFSESPLGTMLQQASQVDKLLPNFLQNLSGALTYLADKTFLLEKALREPNKIWIMDRFLISQDILGAHFIEQENGQDSLQQVIKQMKDWAEESFSDQSLLIVLNTSLPVLKERLEERLQHPLSKKDQKFLKTNIRAYQQYPYNNYQWKKRFIPNEGSLEETIAILLGQIVRSQAEVE